MTGGVISLLQTWDLVLGTLFIARLTLWLLWNKLTIIADLRACLETIQTSLVGISSSSISRARTVLEGGLEPYFVSYLGTEDVWSVNMSDIMRHKISCGTGVGQEQLGRVHIDHACVTLDNSSRVRILGQVSECYGCSLQTLWEPPSHKHANASFQVQTRYPTQLQVEELDQTVICSKYYHFQQYGVYQINATNCDISIETRPVNAFLPIFWAFAFLGLLVGLRLAYQSFYRTAIARRFLVWLQLRSGNQLAADLGEEQDTVQLVETAEVAAKQSRRVRSLDAFRGLSITIMIFVNYGGGSYYFFNHSPWNGLTVADLVFPWFIFIMGVSLVISTQSQLRNSVPRRKLVLRVIKRSAILIFLGLIINSKSGPPTDLRSLRLPGVLQRFGLTYLVVGLTEGLLLPRQYPEVSSPVQDLTSSPCQWLVAASCLTLHSLITFLLPVPDCPTGYLGPGGLADHGAHYNCTGGAGAAVDRAVFGLKHIYQRPTSYTIYGGSPYDPEGLLGTLNSVVLCWLGVAAGKVLLVHKDWKSRVARWLLWSLVTGLLAGALSGFSLNNGIIPINKNLWSISFIMATGSMAFFLLTFMYLLIDVYRFWSGSPLIYPGMNSILMYMGHEIMSGKIPWAWKPFTESHAEILAMNLWGCGLWVATSYILYRKKMFLAL